MREKCVKFFATSCAGPLFFWQREGNFEEKKFWHLVGMAHYCSWEHAQYLNYGLRKILCKASLVMSSEPQSCSKAYKLCLDIAIVRIELE